MAARPPAKGKKILGMSTPVAIAVIGGGALVLYLIWREVHPATTGSSPGTAAPKAATPTVTVLGHWTKPKKKK
jgi:hypothetical protein